LCVAENCDLRTENCHLWHIPAIARQVVWSDKTLLRSLTRPRPMSFQPLREERVWSLRCIPPWHAPCDRISVAPAQSEDSWSDDLYLARGVVQWEYEGTRTPKRLAGAPSAALRIVLASKRDKTCGRSPWWRREGNVDGRPRLGSLILQDGGSWKGCEKVLKRVRWTSTTVFTCRYPRRKR
jgi:hypothetical protein